MMSIAYDFNIFNTPLFPIQELVFVVVLAAVSCFGFFFWNRSSKDSISGMIGFSVVVVIVCISLSTPFLHGVAKARLPLYMENVFSQLPLSQKINVLEEEISFRLRNNGTYRRIFSWDDVIEGKAHVASMSEVELLEAIKSAESSKIKMGNYIKKQEQEK